MAEKNFFLLAFIARNGGLHNEFSSSTSKISREFSLSQQSVSRKLRELAKEKLIELSSSPFGVKAKLTSEGKSILLLHHSQLQEIFFPGQKKPKRLFGTVQSGLGEGKYYMSFKQYSDQIKEKLGFKPFPGTLNLKVSEAELIAFKKNLHETPIEGFSTSQRSFGGLKAFKLKINGKITGALVFPERSNLPPTTAELIAPVFLRKKFNLKDTDKVSMEVH